VLKKGRVEKRAGSIADARHGEQIFFALVIDTASVDAAIFFKHDAT
jgi:hypothetical protein